MCVSNKGSTHSVHDVQHGAVWDDDEKDRDEESEGEQVHGVG